MSSYISLGLSCQSRMTIDAVVGKQRRSPFDYCITEKQALIDALATGGKSFAHNKDSSSIYTMAAERREGIRSGGVYFWHDYPMADRLQLHADWAQHIGQVNEKYDFLWNRFNDNLRASTNPIFVISTTQHNLSQFAKDDSDFAVRFAIDGQFVDKLSGVLRERCANDFSLLAIVRSFAEADSIRCRGASDHITVRFLGRLSLPTHELLVRSFESLAASRSFAALDALEGQYDNGAKIKRESDDACRVSRFRNGKWHPWGEAYVTEGGYLFAFDGHNLLFNAQFIDGRLRFSNNSAWAKV